MCDKRPCTISSLVVKACTQMNYIRSYASYVSLTFLDLIHLLNLTTMWSCLGSITRCNYDYDYDYSIITYLNYDYIKKYGDCDYMIVIIIMIAIVINAIFHTLQVKTYTLDLQYSLFA